MKTIGVIGGGVVGKATARCFVEWTDVKVYDVVREKSTHTLDEVMKQNIIFLCLPTPQNKCDRGCNLNSINRFFSYALIDECNLEANYVLRSTVPIGTTRSLKEKYGLKHIVHSPEFLTSRCAITDAQMPSRMIIGDPNFGILGNTEDTLTDVLGSIYESRFPGTDIFSMSSDESEASKLFLNGFFATKIAYFNEVKSLVDNLGLDWPSILGSMLADGRISFNHIKVPGPDGKYGFGGECLPKDIANLAECLNMHGLPSWVVDGVIHRNELDRARNYNDT